jgi:hypothetical protein
MTLQLWAGVSTALSLGLLLTCLLLLGRGETYRAANAQLLLRVKSLEEPEAVCGCGHHYSFHNFTEGCHYTMVHTHPGRLGPKSVLTTCRCVTYTGPEPMPRLISLELPTKEED